MMLKKTVEHSDSMSWRKGIGGISRKVNVVVVLVLVVAQALSCV